MKYFKSRRKKIFLLLGFVFLVFSFAEGQKLGSLRNSNINQEGNFVIEKGISLEKALAEIEQQFGVVFLYQAGILQNKKVNSRKTLSKNIEKALENLLNGQGVYFKYINPKTYGIFSSKSESTSDTELLVQEEISGTVTDAATGEPLAGVNIIVRGTQRGTSTDGDGRYRLEVSSLQDTLVFTFIGFQEEIIPIRGRTSIDVQMTSETLVGEGVVVTGYGTQEQQQVTGSITSVQSDDFVAGDINNVSELLKGKVSGLALSTPRADPNSNPTIRLRGISSFGANQEPLVVVDGIIGASMNNVDPADIESINVLKDASASAIYGTRGSAGVIVITTKTGQGGEFSTSYKGYQTFETIANRPEVLTAEEYLRLADETGFNALRLGNNTDWFEEISQTGSNSVHNLSFSGGNQDINYRIALNYRNRKGIQKHTGFQKINGRLNFTHRAFNKRLKFDVNMGLTDRSENRGFDEAFRYAAIMVPTAPVEVGTDSMPGTNGFFEKNIAGFFNPANIIEEGKQTGEIKSFNGSITGRYEFRRLVPNLSVKATYSLETTNSIDRNFFARTHKMDGGATPTVLGPGLAQKGNDNSREEFFQTQVNFQTDLNKLSFEGLAGYSWQRFINSGTWNSGGDFITDEVEYNNFSFAQDFNQGEGNVDSYKNRNRIVGFFSRTSINWDETYFINGSIRREGSTRFGVDNKWGLFWSGGIGIELTSLIEVPLNQLKLRASYGKTGQDAPFSGIAQQQFAPQGNFFVNNRFVQSFGPVSNANPKLKWEEKRELNAGFEFATLNDRLSGSAEYYRSIVDDLLFNVSVPVPPNLFPRTWKNVGQLDKWGIEGSLDWNVFQRSSGLSWNTSFNAAYFGTATLDEFVTEQTRFISNAGAPGLNDTPLIRVQAGEPVGQIWGPEFAEIGPDGRWLFFDKDGNKITADEVTREDEKVLGHGLPDFQLGWSNRISYKSWDFRMSARGVFGHQLINMMNLFYQAPISISNFNVLKSSFEVKDLTDAPQFSSKYVENADFFRIENVTVGYTLPVFENSPVKRLRAYVAVNNLVTITEYDGVNPEVQWTDSNGGPLAPGIDRRNQWYTSRTFSVGINLDF